MGRGKAKNKDGKTSWAERIRQHPIFLSVALIGAIIGGVATFSKDLFDIFGSFSDLTNKPSILAFGLSPSASGFSDEQEVIFGASENTIRTFGPVYPFLEIPRAILLISVDNPEKEDLILTSVIYDVEEASEVKGGPAGPLTPKGKYEHKIKHVAGRQKLSLMPPFRIPAKSAESLELELTSATDGHGLGWLLKIVIETNFGDISTEQFQIYLPDFPSVLEQGSLSENRTTVDRVPQNPNQNSSEMLHPSIRDNLFRATGILEYVEHLDHLDRDLLSIRAKNNPYAEFSEKTTATEPPKKYRDFIPKRNLQLFWKNANGSAQSDSSVSNPSPTSGMDSPESRTTRPSGSQD